MGAIAELATPQTGAVTDLPNPNAVQAPLDDAAAYRATSGSFRRGLRSSFNGLGAAATALAGAVGNSMGLTEFADERYKEAADFVAFGDAVGPRVRDYRAVKDVTDAVDYVAGLGGQAAGSMAPALITGGAGALAGGLRGAAVGAYTGSLIPESGEQVLRVKDTPGATPGDVLANSLGKGAVNAALDTAALAVPGGAVAKGLRAAAPRAATTLAKGTVAEGATEGLQEAVGQGFHTAINPARDKSEDKPDIINAVAGGAVGGFGLGGAAAVTSKAGEPLGAARKALGKREPVPVDESVPTTMEGAKNALDVSERPLDPNDYADAPDDPNQVPAWLDLRDNAAVQQLNRVWNKVKDSPEAQKFKDFATDPEARDNFSEWAGEQYKRVTDHPATRRAAAGFKGAVEGLKRPLPEGEKASDVRTAMDFALYDNMLKHVPAEKLDALSPAERVSLSDDLKHYALHVYGTDKGKRLPHSIMDLAGEQLPALLESHREILGKGGLPVGSFDAKRGVEQASAARRVQDTRLEGVVRSSLRPAHIADPETREYIVKELARDLSKRVTEGVDDWQAFDKKLDYAFGPRADHVLAQFDAERGNVTRGYEHFVDQEQEEQALSKQEIERKLSENERFRVTREDEAVETERPAPEEERSPYRDKRLGVPLEEMSEAPKVRKQLEQEYDPKVVKFRAEPVLDEEGNLTGKIAIHAEDAQSSASYSDEQWQRIQEKHGQAGAEKGVITVRRFRRLDPDTGKPTLGKNGNPLVDNFAVSIPNLVAETMASTGRRGGGNIEFVHDMVMRGLSNLLSDPRFDGFRNGTGRQLTEGDLERGGLKIPDEAIVANVGGKLITWGEVRSESARGHRDKQREYWDGIVQGLATELAQARKAAAKQGVELDPESKMGQYAAIRERALTAETLEEMNATQREYREFVREHAQGIEEEASGYTRDEHREGMISTPAILEAERRITETDKITARIEELETRIKQDRAGYDPASLAMRDAALQRDIRRLWKKWERLNTTAGRVGVSSSMHEQDEFQDGDQKPRDYQEETGEALGPQRRMGRNQAKRELAGGTQGGEVKITKFDTPSKLSELGTGDAQVTPEQEAEVRAYVKRVLGDRQTEVLFKEMDKAGSFAKLSGVETLAISIRAIDPMGVGYHEAAHALVSRLRIVNNKAANALMAAAGSPSINAQLRSLLKGEEGALKQLSDPEERLAYMYQFWAAGKLQMGPKVEGTFQLIKAMLRSTANFLLGVGDDEVSLMQADRILRAFHSGQLANRTPAVQALARIIPPEQPKHWLAKLGHFVEKIWSTSDGLVRDFRIPAMTTIADKFFNPGEGGSGFVQTKHVQRNQYMNRVAEALRPLDDAAEARVLKALQTGTPGQPGPERAAVLAIRATLDDMFTYMVHSKVKVVEWNPDEKAYEEHDIRRVANFFPRAYDRSVIEARFADFVQLLERHGLAPEMAEETARKMMAPNKASPEESDMSAGLTYYAPSTMERKLNIPEAELEPFMKKDLSSILYDYTNYAVRRAEYASRFGNQGQIIQEAIAQAEKEGATPEQLKTFSGYVQSMEGSLGNNIDPKLRHFFGAVMTYQNLRLLPLALFSSLIDPNGIVLRGGKVSEGFDAFRRGVSELVSDKQDEKREFARLVGAINEATDEHMVAEMYGANYAGQWQKWLNQKLFKLNGMESWNNSMRIVAATAAKNFILRHAERPGEHSERYLAELGLSAEDVRIDNGELELTPQTVDAINKWVDGAVLRPHAGVRPIWMSDPHFMLVSHLKQFSYSFQKTIVARTAHEAMHGNFRPLAVLGSYVPFIIAADMLRALVTPGSADDERLKRWGLKDWVVHGIGRAGISGPGQYALDAFTDMEHGKLGIESLGGPTVQQISDMAHAAVGDKGSSLGRELLRAVPPVPTLNLKS